MGKLLRNYFILFLILVVLNIILIAITGNGYLMYPFFYLYGFFALLALVNILYYIMIYYKGARIYVLGFVLLMGIGIWLTYYGGELYGKFLLYKSRKNFPSMLETFAAIIEEDATTRDGKEIIPFGDHKGFYLENYVMTQQHELVAIYREISESFLREGDIEGFVKKFDMNGNLIGTLSLYHSEGKSKIFLVEDCLIDISNRTYNNAWLSGRDSVFRPMKLVEGSQGWNFQQAKDFYYNRSQESSYCHIIKMPSWLLPDKGDFPKAEEPSYMIVFLKDQQLYYYLTPYDIIDYYYFGKKHYQIKSPEHTSAPLLMALRNDQLYNQEHLGKGERSSQRTDIEPVYYLQDDIECTGLEPLEPLRSFEVKRGEGELYYRLKVDDQVLSLKASYFIHSNYERSLKTPTYYWKNHTETIEKYKNIYLYSNKNIKYRLLDTFNGIYIVK